MESDCLTICDDYDLTLESMMGITEQMRESGKQIDLIVVDYIQLVTLSNVRDKSREQQVAEVSRTLKKLAKRHNCPVITASQLNDDGKVRESRAILQDADVLINVVPNDHLLLAKNRDGQRFVEMPLVMNGSIQKFVRK